MKTKINYQKSDGKWYELVCYDYSIEQEPEKLAFGCNDYVVTVPEKSCCSCANLLTCIQDRPNAVLQMLIGEKGV